MMINYGILKTSDRLIVRNLFNKIQIDIFDMLYCCFKRKMNIRKNIISIL